MVGAKKKLIETIEKLDFSFLGVNSLQSCPRFREPVNRFSFHRSLILDKRSVTMVRFSVPFFTGYAQFSVPKLVCMYVQMISQTSLRIVGSPYFVYYL